MTMAHIGVFDSGVGGLSVLQALQSRMPEQRYSYFADSLHAPYGGLDAETLLKYSERIVSFLISKGASLIVVACNTVTTSLIGELRQRFELPFVGVEPAVKPAAAMTLNGRIGVLATQGTLNSTGYRATCQKFASEVTLIERAGVGLVEAIEHLPWDSEALRTRVQSFADEFNRAQIDTLVLGCTHYPLIESLFRECLAEEIKIVSAAEAVARRVEQLVPTNDYSASLDFYTSAAATQLAPFISRMAFQHVKGIHQVTLE